MSQKVDFKKYDYFFNGWIARKNKTSGKTEMFVNGQWTATTFPRGLENMASIGDEDIVKLDERYSMFLQEQIKAKIAKGKGI